uniref:GRF-type domain-containing protein n=1 Tax=Leersia perrieri TaxID=77586 RepID=A0A0D9XCL2_9ORYZ
MASPGSSASSAAARNIARRRKSRLPLILCPRCENKMVVELAATTEANRGHIFYTCTDHMKDGLGCNFWFWEEGYLRYLTRHGLIGDDEIEQPYAGLKQSVRQEQTNLAVGAICLK